MKRLLLTLTLAAATMLSKAQTSISTAGGDASGSGGSIAYSVGQLVYTANSGSGGTMAQGVQHSYENTVLSIKFGNVSATNAGNYNRLFWNSTDETDAHIYEVERSNDAVNFGKLAEVKPNGLPSHYSYPDYKANEGVSYYRIKAINTDGTYSYTKVVSATVKELGNFRIYAYPNPTQSNTTISTQGSKGAGAVITVTDIIGRIVYQIKNINTNEIALPIAHLANGLYHVTYTDANRTESIKIIKGN